MSDNSPTDPGLLLTLFKEDLVRRLVDEAIAAIRPSIVKNAHDAVASLNAAIQKHYDVCAEQTVVALLIKEPK